MWFLIYMVYFHFCCIQKILKYSLNFKSHYLYDILMNVAFYEYKFKERFLLILKNILAYQTN